MKREIGVHPVRFIKITTASVILFLSAPVQALQWQDLWRTRDQQAQSAFRQRQFEQAAEKFAQPEWKAAALYKAGRYQQVIETLKDINDSDAFYNKGNAFAKLGHLQEALEAYNKALTINPENTDARYNKELIEKELEKQQQQQNNENSRDKKDNPENQQQQDAQSERQQNQSGQQNKRNEHSARQSEPNDNSSEQQTQQQQSTKKQQQQKETERQAAESQPDKEELMQNQSLIESRDESRQANEQWLKRIPDDPAGLLKRKFAYQYQKRKGSRHNREQQW